MTDQEREKLKKFMAEWAAKKVAEGPEACRRYLIGAGFYREDGRLMPGYGGELDPGEEDPWLYMLSVVAK